MAKIPQDKLDLITKTCEELESDIFKIKELALVVNSDGVPYHNSSIQVSEANRQVLIDEYEQLKTNLIEKVNLLP